MEEAFDVIFDAEELDSDGAFFATRPWSSALAVVPHGVVDAVVGAPLAMEKLLGETLMSFTFSMLAARTNCLYAYSDASDFLPKKEVCDHLIHIGVLHEGPEDPASRNRTLRSPFSRKQLLSLLLDDRIAPHLGSNTCEYATLLTRRPNSRVLRDNRPFDPMCSIVQLLHSGKSLDTIVGSSWKSNESFLDRSEFVRCVFLFRFIGVDVQASVDSRAKDFPFFRAFLPTNRREDTEYEWWHQTLDCVRRKSDLKDDELLYVLCARGLRNMEYTPWEHVPWALREVAVLRALVRHLPHEPSTTLDATFARTDHYRHGQRHSEGSDGSTCIHTVSDRILRLVDGRVVRVESALNAGTCCYVVEDRIHEKRCTATGIATYFDVRIDKPFGKPLVKRRSYFGPHVDAGMSVFYACSVTDPNEECNDESFGVEAKFDCGLVLRRSPKSPKSRVFTFEAPHFKANTIEVKCGNKLVEWIQSSGIRLVFDSAQEMRFAPRHAHYGWTMRCIEDQVYRVSDCSDAKLAERFEDVSYGPTISFRSVLEKESIDPRDMCCPIGLLLATDPVTLDDGAVTMAYSKQNITQHLQASRLSPVTRQIVKNVTEDRRKWALVQHFRKLVLAHEQQTLRCFV